MNFCTIVCADRDKNKQEQVVFSIVSHQGDQTYQLTKERQAVWLARIKREDIRPQNYPHTRVYCVYSDHFVTGKPAQLYDRSHQDWWKAAKGIGQSEQQKSS